MRPREALVIQGRNGEGCHASISDPHHHLPEATTPRGGPSGPRARFRPGSPRSPVGRRISLGARPPTADDRTSQPGSPCSVLHAWRSGSMRSRNQRTDVLVELDPDADARRITPPDATSELGDCRGVPRLPGRRVQGLRSAPGIHDSLPGRRADPHFAVNRRRSPFVRPTRLQDGPCGRAGRSARFVDRPLRRGRFRVGLVAHQGYPIRGIRA